MLPWHHWYRWYGHSMAAPVFEEEKWCCWDLSMCSYSQSFPKFLWGFRCPKLQQEDFDQSHINISGTRDETNACRMETGLMDASTKWINGIGVMATFKHHGVPDKSFLPTHISFPHWEFERVLLWDGRKYQKAAKVRRKAQWCYKHPSS